jgi:hypothetical protein
MIVVATCDGRKPGHDGTQTSNECRFRSKAQLSPPMI